MEATVRLNTKLIRNLSKALYMPAAEIVAVTGMNRSTWYRIAESPQIITVQQLLTVANSLHVPVRRFFSAGRADVVGKPEDYVADPYQDCSYDADALQGTVEGRPDISWQQAADATGVTRDNLRMSLLGVTHTPVLRFLKACQAWDIDPFTILKDPNQEPARERKTRGVGPSEIRQEIGELRKDIRALSDTVGELTSKYEALMKAHAALARSFRVNFENVNGSHISIAADDLLQPEPDK